LNAMLYGNGMNLLAWTEEMNFTARTFKVPTRDVTKFKVGDQVRIMTANNDDLGVGTVSAINGDVITYTGTVTAFERQDRFYVYSAINDGTQINGVDSIFMHDKLYNIDKVTNPDLNPLVTPANLGASGAPNPMRETDVLDFLYQYEAHCEGNPMDIILTHPNVRRAIHHELRSFRANMDVCEFDAGFKGFMFNGMPVFVDGKCKAGTLYGLNSDSWAMHQLCDWTWLSGDEGDVLKQIDGKAGYSATLVKYADLLCDKPFFQGKTTNFSARRFS